MNGCCCWYGFDLKMIKFLDGILIFKIMDWDIWLGIVDYYDY